MQFPSKLKFANSYFFNPIVRIFAGQILVPLAIIIHKGRLSGNQFKIPVVAAPVNDGFVIALVYGEKVDWYQNVLRAGECAIKWQGKTYQVKGPIDVSQKAGIAAFPVWFRPFEKLMNFEHYIYLKF
jgi:hypothetical protein